MSRFVYAPSEPPFIDRGLNPLWLADETRCVQALLKQARLDDAARTRVHERATSLVNHVRDAQAGKGGVEALMQQYDLSSQEGVVLMCMAEALLRIPDAETADKLIADKLADGDWAAHQGASRSMFVNASTWGLMLTGRIVNVDEDAQADPAGYVRRMVARLGEPVIRTATRQAMRIMGHQFVMGRTIKEALQRADTREHRGYRHSYDMLGEAALTAKDAQRYFDAYSGAIAAIGASVQPGETVFAAPSISVKLSALHPRYEFAQRRRVLEELVPRVVALAKQAKSLGIALTIDAEEAERLDLSLDVFEAVYRSLELDGWEGFGLAVQAYQKRASALVDWVVKLAQEVGRRIPVRLVKGAYWDTEIKRAQERGLEGYPVFTRKASTDVSYLACARKLLAARDAVYPQFATHNAHTLSSIIEMAGDEGDYEFQRLHGMGMDLYAQVAQPDGFNLPCRVYAPVGSHEDLLPYLVRRLLENGANSSFVNRISDERIAVAEIVADPVAEVERLETIPHPRIPLPAALYGSGRTNSRGINLQDPERLRRLATEMEASLKAPHSGAPVICGKRFERGEVLEVHNPANRSEVVGTYRHIDDAGLDEALAAAHRAQPAWDATPATRRAEVLERAADLFELHTPELMALCTREAGKSIPDGIAEVREAVDFLRYYAQRARLDFAQPLRMPGPTGESNELSLHGRGVFLCISPWNFPLAIFTGQVAAALAAGNTVLAKPAETTTLVAARAVALLHEAGIPGDVLHFTPGRGSAIGKRAIPDARVAGVVFTGSTEVAQTINRQLAERDGAIPVLIAETGGQNAMLVDSSALPEQVVLDVVASAFNSAGQRCSALRVLFLQDDVADRVIELLTGYLDELAIADPALLSTDIGPVIDAPSLEGLDAHAEKIATQGEVHKRIAVPESLDGHFFSPMAVEISGIEVLEREVFGPVLHIVRWKANELDRVIDAINATGYGLTLGVHSRIDATQRRVQRRVRVGNTYINRNMIGAVVGVQPFGGQGLSGTGPKAGGPHYLHRFATERTLTINTAAVGGNASLLSLGDD
ncbi:MAG: bifunctional proline dehydrogenase/L-glutamate gamma-semialdehyde dehydrogenase PutA [Gammaproteobacteria bacterium]